TRSRGTAPSGSTTLVLPVWRLHRHVARTRASSSTRGRRRTTSRRRSRSRTSSEPRGARSPSSTRSRRFGSGCARRRSSLDGSSRRMAVTLATSGEVLLPPTADEHLEALEDSWLTVVSPAALAALHRVAGASALVVDALVEALRERQETIGNFASVRHVERV